MDKFMDSEISLDDISLDFEEEKIDHRVAIIGMSIHTSSGNTSAFWEDIKNGCNLISAFRGTRKEDIEAYHTIQRKEYAYAEGSFIQDIDTFDYKYFNMTPKEAQLMDPSHRLFLQNTVHAIEDAGYGNHRLENTNTRIFVGYAGNIKDSYLNMIWNTNSKDLSMSIVNNMTGMISGRLSHMLNTRGVAEIIDATCASSLIAVHEGCESIISGQSNLAIVGSMRLNLMPIESDMARIGVESKDYQTRTFDENASGFGEGDGVVTLILKSYQQAVEDQDHIHAVIKGSAVSQGGESMGLTVTNPTALKDTIANVIMETNHDIDTIGMYELHGTATNLGDPIEMQGMEEAFRLFTEKNAFCAIGSVKSNMGHLYEASGIMGLVKTVLAMKHKTIPPTINLTEPNKEIHFAKSPFYINTKAREWQCENGKRSALVNSLGLNGANCCMLVEEYDNNYEESTPIEQRFLVLSAVSEESLQRLADSYQAYLSKNDVNLDDLCYTAAVGRWHHKKRAFFEFETKKGLIQLLSSYAKDESKAVVFTENSRAKTGSNLEYEAIKQRYCEGEDVDWEAYFEEPRKIIHLPVYPFERNRCWIDYDAEQEYEEKTESHLYDVVWEKKDLIGPSLDVKEITVIGLQRERVEAYVSYFVKNHIKAEGICLQEKAADCIEAYPHVLFTTEGYQEENLQVEKIKGLMLFLADLCKNPSVKHLTFLSKPVHVIEGTEAVDRLDAVLTAYVRAIQKENENLKMHIMETDDSICFEDIISKVMKEEACYLACRKGISYIPVVAKKDTKEEKESVIGKGTYLVTAGTSYVTLEVCSQIAKLYPESTFIFLARKLQNYDSKWNEDGLQSYDSKLAEYYRGIQEQNCRILVKKADICNAENLKTVLRELEKEQIIPKYLVHSAAGDMSFAYTETDSEKLDFVLDPKIKALDYIESLVGQHLQGYVLFSSMATTFMAPMQSGYIAANAYLDGFCREKCLEGKKAVALQWSTWKEIGMAARNNLAYDLIFEAMPTKIALSYLDEILKKGIRGTTIIGKFNESAMGRKLIENSKVLLAKNVMPSEQKKTVKKVQKSKIELTGRNKDNYTLMEKRISQICREVLGYTSINIYENFFEMGADSLQIMNLHKQIEKEFPGKLEITDMFSYSNVYKLANYLFDEGNESLLTEEMEENAGQQERQVEQRITAENIVETEGEHLDDIAIVGIAAKIPGVNDLKEFYDSLLRGECFVNDLPAWRKEFLTKYYHYTKQELKENAFAQSAYLDDIDQFDYEFFQLSPREASLMDPHQRLFLELALEAIEDAGHSLDSMSQTKTGVFLGFGTNIKDMYMRILSDVQREDVADAIVGNAQAILAGRISHDLNLKGASMVIDTACSSSIVALNTAVSYIKSKQIESALVGGIKLLLCPVEDADLYTIGMESGDGYTRTFDQTATGTAFGESAQMILIKSYQKAVEDGDHIYGVIKSIAINQDGNSASVTAPNPISQQEVILEAWKGAKINPEDIGYVEVHGTATRLGDTIEYKSLNEAFKRYTKKKHICAVNTVKPNYGHMSEGAGLFGLIKGLQVLQYGVIPKNILFDRPNSSIDMIDSAIYYNTQNIEWKAEGKKRTFALSNFGMSGTNTHLVVQEVKRACAPSILRKKRIFAISNRTKEGLFQEIQKLYAYITTREVDFHNLSYTLAVGRNHYENRFAVVCESMQELQAAIQQYLEAGVLGHNAFAGGKKVVSDDRVQLASNEMHLSEQMQLTEQVRTMEKEEQVAEFYCKGAKVAFERFYAGEVLYRISIPTYCFTKKSCWIRIPDVYDVDEQLYYTLDWKKKAAKKLSMTVHQGCKYIAIVDEKDQKHQELIQALEAKGGIRLAIYGIHEFLAQYATVEKMQELLAKECADGAEGMIQLMPTKDSVYQEQSYQLCLQLFRTTKAIVQNNLTSDFKIVTISYQAFRVNQEKKGFQPLGAIGHGINRVIHLEVPNVSTVAIDIDLETDSQYLADEILCEKQDHFYVAYRKNERYVQEMTPEYITTASTAYEVKTQGVYVITGGTGGIGLYYAKCFAEVNPNVHIVLVARSDRFKQNQEAMDKIKKLSAMGTGIETIIGDVSDGEKVNEIFKSIRSKYGRINGVIHAAGNASAQIMALREEEEFLKVMRPKYEGTWNVFQQIRKENVDFFVLCSSGCTLTGEASQADYVAANSYLDAFTYYANEQNVKTHCINFSSWKSEGMSVRYEINVDSFFKALDNADAKKALFDVICSKNERCFVGRINASFCRDQAIDLSSLPFDVSPEIEDALAIQGGANKIDFVPSKTKSNIREVQTILEGNDEKTASYSETEKEIAAMISKVLGVDTIHIYDSFFELGGDSILLGRLHGMIDQKYPGKMKLLDLFAYSSVKKIAEFLTNGDASDVSEDVSAEQKDMTESSEQIDDLVERFERGEISIDEMLGEIM